MTMIPRQLCAPAVLFSVVFGGCFEPAREPSQVTPTDVYAARQELGAKDLWPGFDPRATPLAIYDGEETWLFGHAQPPEGFESLPGSAIGTIFEGRHPRVVANSSAEIGGVAVATLMPATLEAGVRAAAATAIHETFHVFERERFPGWMANEMDAFSYPDEDAVLLALRRRESRALYRALEADAAVDAACWSRAGLENRQRRFGAMPPQSVAYERQLELFEGLAQYLEYRAAGIPHPGDGVFPADAVRWRVYWSGHALARLLDRFSKDWQERLSAADGLYLDHMLSEALAAQPADEKTCVLSDERGQRLESQAAEDILALRRERESARQELLSAPGWRLVVESPGAPFWPQGFDPLNLENLGDGQLLHTRFLKVGNEAGTVNVMGQRALTEGAGDHPLFQGIRRVILPGLPEAPEVVEEDGRVQVTVGEVTVDLLGVTIEREEKILRLRIGE